MGHQLYSLHDARSGAGKLFLTGPGSKYFGIPQALGSLYPVLNHCRAKSAQ